MSMTGRVEFQSAKCGTFPKISGHTGRKLSIKNLFYNLFLGPFQVCPNLAGLFFLRHTFAMFMNV